MLEYLASLDQTLFWFINVTLSNPVTDFGMPLMTSDNFLRISYVMTMIVLLWKGSPRLRWLVLFSVIALIVADQLTSSFLKPLFSRPRPCHIMMNINLLINCGSGFTMPSSHAANAFAQATLFSICMRGTRYYLYVIAGLIALSRVFVGVHYPFDVVAGAGVGIVVGIATVYLFEIFEAKMQNRLRIVAVKGTSVNDSKGTDTT